MLYDQGCNKWSALKPLPLKSPPYLQNVASRDVIVIEHVSLGQNLLIPSREIALFRNREADKLGVLDGLLNLLDWGLLGNLLRCGLAVELLVPAIPDAPGETYTAASEKSRMVSLTPVDSRCVLIAAPVTKMVSVEVEVWMASGFSESTRRWSRATWRPAALSLVTESGETYGL